ncbi:MAG: aminotransferase class V-fold PLP-dependent enzyme [Candidatus Cloacimonetes bacterium]|nr:aminotransferase class V-fold PLP-dependent enzyme [Candidatus Cloacimonadota bacterium]
MKTKEIIKSLEWLRNDIIGRNKLFITPFGEKPLVYADYTASGRCLFSIENYMMYIMQYYANTHTKDDFTGKIMTELLHDSEKSIKSLVNAGEKGKIIFTESGTTGGITRLQQILGVYWPPATRERINKYLGSCLERYPAETECNKQLLDFIQNHKPIVFVGPYEHHSNEIMWRKALCDVLEVPLNAQEEIDLNALEEMVSDKKYDQRPKIGSFSAASNVSGLKTPVYEVARILHRHGAIACFDFAACAPYIEIDMNHDAESCFDAIYLSPHKFLGGPGSSGVLIFNENIYAKELPPTIAAGGTVDFVSLEGEEYIQDIETREKPGTPGILQAIKTSLIFQTKAKVGVDNIDKIESYLYNKFQNAFKGEKNILFYGSQELEKKIPIIPFNIVNNEQILHPKFVTRLLNDLFGIQTRAGCSCAGPYGHKLMKIETQVSHYYRCMITNVGYSGIKPGWVRLNLHYALSEEELDYIISAIKFAVKYAQRFIPQYIFDIKTGDWKHISDEIDDKPIELDIDKAYKIPKFKIEIAEDIPRNYQQNIDNAVKIAENLPFDFERVTFEPELGELIYFPVKNIINYKKNEGKHYV